MTTSATAVSSPQSVPVVQTTNSLATDGANKWAIRMSCWHQELLLE